MTELEKVKSNLASGEQPIINIASATNDVLQRVFLWMSLALVISGLSAWLVASSPALIQTLYSSPAIFFGLMIVEIALVIGISAGINRLSSATATVLFIVYSIINGVVLSSIFLVYSLGTIAMVFFITAGTFACMAVIGYTTQKDLSGWGRYLMMALIGLIIASVVSIFTASTTLDWIINLGGVVLFVLLTAYDTQMIKRLVANTAEQGEEIGNKVAIIGALTLYLDFINLFLKLLAIFGRRD